MAKRETPSATARAVIARLAYLRPMTACGDEQVSWAIGDGCRVWFSLTDNSMSKVPLIGLVLPSVSSRSTELMLQSGMRIPIEPGTEWACQPAITVELTHFAPVSDPGVFQYLARTAEPATENTELIVSIMLEGEQKLIAEAGDLPRALAWMQGVGPRHPSPPWTVPVGYHQLGMLEEAQAFADECSAHFASLGQQQLVEMYRRYIDTMFGR